jgi:hypothetical protein
LILALVAVSMRETAAGPLVANDWVGKRVVQKSPDHSLEVDRKLVETTSFETYSVTQVDGRRLFLRGPVFSGWVEADQVVPIEKAEAIQLDPKNPSLYGRRAYILATCPDAKYRDGKESRSIGDDWVRIIRLGRPRLAIHPGRILRRGRRFRRRHRLGDPWRRADSG